MMTVEMCERDVMDFLGVIMMVTVYTSAWGRRQTGKKMLD